MTICCRYDVYQSNIGYSEVKQSVLREDRTITKYKPSEPQYEDVKIADKPNCGVKMNPNPAYHCNATLNANPAYQATTCT